MTKLPEKTHRAGTWVQTDRKAHELWAHLCVMNPRAGALLHVLASRVGENNAVVASQETLGELMGCSVSTVKRALQALKAGNWLEIKQFGKTTSVNVYVMNDRVVWSGRRDGLRFSQFSANVVLSEAEQPDRDSPDSKEPLHRLPQVGERQMPVGEGLPPPSEPALPWMDQDLPATPERRGEPMPIGALVGRLVQDREPSE